MEEEVFFKCLLGIRWVGFYIALGEYYPNLHASS